MALHFQKKVLCKFFQTAQVNIDNRNYNYASPKASDKGQSVNLSSSSFPGSYHYCRTICRPLSISSPEHLSCWESISAAQLPDFCEREVNTWITNIATINIEFLNTLWYTTPWPMLKNIFFLNYSYSSERLRPVRSLQTVKDENRNRPILNTETVPLKFSIILGGYTLKWCSFHFPSNLVEICQLCLLRIQNKRKISTTNTNKRHEHLIQGFLVS